MDNLSFLHDAFLIAMPQMKNPMFRQAVVYICEHNAEGAMGVMINYHLQLSVFDLLKQMDIRQEKYPPLKEEKIFLGGPVQPEHGFVLHSSNSSWNTTLETSSEINLTLSRDILEAIAEDKGPVRRLVSLGYMGWSPSQLEEELADNLWLTAPANQEIIFQTPLALRWEHAINLLGIDREQLSSDVGHG